MSKQYGGTIVSRNGLALLHGGEAYCTIASFNLAIRRDAWIHQANKFNQPVKVTFT